MWCNKNTKGREREEKRGVGARIPALWAWHLSILQCQGKEIFKKNGKIVLFRLFITRILIWKSGRNRGSFYLGGGGGGGGVSSFHSECIHD